MTTKEWINCFEHPIVPTLIRVYSPREATVHLFMSEKQSKKTISVDCYRGGKARDVKTAYHDYSRLKELFPEVFAALAKVYRLKPSSEMPVEETPLVTSAPAILAPDAPDWNVRDESLNNFNGLHYSNEFYIMHHEDGTFSSACHTVFGVGTRSGNRVERVRIELNLARSEPPLFDPKVITMGRMLRIFREDRPLETMDWKTLSMLRIEKLLHCQADYILKGWGYRECPDLRWDDNREPFMEHLLGTVFTGWDIVEDGECEWHFSYWLMRCEENTKKIGLRIRMAIFFETDDSTPPEQPKRPWGAILTLEKIVPGQPVLFYHLYLTREQAVEVMRTNFPLPHITTLEARVTEGEVKTVYVFASEPLEKGVEPYFFCYNTADAANARMKELRRDPATRFAARYTRFNATVAEGDVFSQIEPYIIAHPDLVNRVAPLDILLPAPPLDFPVVDAAEAEKTLAALAHTSTPPLPRITLHYGPGAVVKSVVPLELIMKLMPLITARRMAVRLFHHSPIDNWLVVFDAASTADLKNVLHEAGITYRDEASA